MLQWLLDRTPAPASVLPTAVPVLVMVAMAVSAALVMKSKRSPATRTRPPRQLKSQLPVLQDLVAIVGAASRMHDWTMAALEEVDFAPFMVRAPGMPDITMLCSPEAFEDVFKTQFEAFPKGEFQIGILQDLLGDGIFAVDGEQWVTQRKTASRLFTMRALRESMTTTIRKHSVVLLEIFERASKSGDRLDLFNLFNRFTIEAFAEIGFGVSMGCLDSAEDHPFTRAFDAAQRQTAKRLMRPTWFWKTQRLLGVGAEKHLRSCVQVVDSTVLDIIHESMAKRQGRDQVPKANDQAHDGKGDIVSLFLDNYASITGDANATSFNPKFLRDIVVNFLIAGRDTTAQALSWFFYCIDRNPNVADKIRQELHEKIPELFGLTNEVPTMEQVAPLVYLEAALRETLRLYPSVPLSSKDAAHDVVLSDGTPIRAGTTVFLAFYAMGRNPHVWGPDAAEYKPERWIEYSEGSDKPKIKNVSAFKFIAFNAGPRTCLGMNLAMLEMKIVVASLLSRFRVTLTDPEHVTYEFSITLPVKGSLSARIARLSPAAAM